jgi:NADPH-dependent stearoyl-CoA 9-desaturase
VLAFMSGNLCYQIEHHLYPDLPSNRYAQIAQRVQHVCAKYDLPYTTGPLAYQYLLTLRTIIKLALPNRFLRATPEDAPETASEDRFDHRMRGANPGANAAARRRGLATAISNRNEHRNQRRTARGRIAAKPQ